jgi:predicted AAA+ superfamily ATPase
MSKFIDLEKLINGEKNSLAQIRNYFRVSHWAYKLFHSQDGFMHFRISKSGAFTDEDIYHQPDAIADYIKALRKLFVIEDLDAWNPNIRSKAAIRTSDTRHFVDPSIGTASLGLGPQDLINDLDSFGLIFEDLAVRDLRVFAEALDGRLYHYRDSSGLECDTVLHRRNGTYGLIEIKLGGEKLINDGAEALNTLADTIDTTKMKKPSFKMVLTAVGPYAYQRPDEIFVVPIGCLKD